MKYLLYDIQYNEQFFKQFSGFLYYLKSALEYNCTLVIPHFRTLPKDKANMTIKDDENFGYYAWENFYNLELLKKSFNIITIDEFKELNMDIDVLYSKTDRFITDNSIKISNIDFNFKTRINNLSKIDNKNIIAICGTTSQYPYSTPGYLDLRKKVRYHDYLYNLVDKFLQEKNIIRYISIHWRQTDFLTVRSKRTDVLNTPEQLVKKCKRIMKQTGIEKIYLATDSKDFIKLKYINDNLPLFFYDTNKLDLPKDKYKYSIIESIICAKADIFYGTKTSLYSINICGERACLGLDHKQYYI